MAFRANSEVERAEEMMGVIDEKRHVRDLLSHVNHATNSTVRCIVPV